jgi:hypothetical protein
MPAAAGHSLGNSNVVKAQVLFTFFRGGIELARRQRDHVLPPLVPAVPA